MKVLFINPSAAPYGSGQSMLNLLRASSFQSEVVCPSAGPLEANLKALAIKVHPLEFGKHAFFRNPAWSYHFYRQFQRILHESSPDVMVINLDGNTPLVTLAAIQAGVPFVRYCRFEFEPPRRWLHKYCWLKASAVICPTEHVRRQFLDWAPAHFQPRVHCYYDAHQDHVVTPQETQRLRLELGLGDAKTIGFIGRLHRGKRIETAIQALPRIRSCQPKSCLLIIGSHDGSPNGVAYECELKELAIKLGVESGVHFLGYRSQHEVPVAMSACDVTVLPSESESFGMVLTESWALQVPTVASDLSGCREITQASGAGFLFPVGDAEQLSKGVLNLISDSALARTLGVRGQKWIKTNCDPEVYAKRFHELLHEVALS